MKSPFKKLFHLSVVALTRVDIPRRKRVSIVAKWVGHLQKWINFDFISLVWDGHFLPFTSKIQPLIEQQPWLIGNSLEKALVICLKKYVEVIKAMRTIISDEKNWPQLIYLYTRITTPFIFEMKKYPFRYIIFLLCSFTIRSHCWRTWKISCENRLPLHLTQL